MPAKINYSRRLDMPIDRIASICEVTRTTALRWEREGYPYQAQRLCELTRDGRIVPDKWRHARFNTRGNIELHSGEARESDVLNIPYMRLVTAQLRKQIQEQRAEIDALKKMINELDNSAANDAFLL